LAVVYFLSIGLGALFFVTLQHLTRAGWSVAVRRLAELMAATLPLVALLLVPILAAMVQGNPSLYIWVDDNMVQADELLRAKQAYLNVPFFLLRVVVYFLVWAILSRFFLRNSLRQDQSGDLRLSAAMQRMSAPGMMLFALTTTFCAVDLLMSLTPHWYSTVFGVYFFAGSVIGFLATTILATQALQSQGVLRQTVTVEHFHDLGKLLFGFVFFWGYIAFSQYMLIWYANMPEETEWFLKRQTGGWVWVSLVLLFGHFIMPFAGLLSRHVKRHRQALAFWACWMLVMHWLDLYWLVMPSLREEQPPFSVMDLTCFVGVGGLAIAAFAYGARGKLLLPAKDPRLDESLAFENI
jgi:hypothetical protein